MNSSWSCHPTSLKFRFSDKTLFSLALNLKVREVGLLDDILPTSAPEPPDEPLDSACSGFLIRSLPVQEKLPALRWLSDYLCYVPSQYQRYYIDLRQSFADYKQKFSSKTRSTINRKIKKFAEHCGGSICWKAYKTPEQIAEFYLLARIVSSKTYQERILAAGLPESQAFSQEIFDLATQDQVRGYILFDHSRPTAYLYCPVSRGVVLYQYLGYDPDYIEWSVGTILQWLALEELFIEGCFRIFDFTEGESEHKRQFATNSIQCANVYFLRRTFANALIVQSHLVVNRLSGRLGKSLDRVGLKTKIKKLIRFGRWSSPKTV